MKKPSGDTRPGALLVCPEAPYPMAGGGAMRTASLIECLGRRYALDLIIFREPGTGDPRAAVPPGLVREISLVDLPRHSRAFIPRLTRNAIRYLRNRPPLNDRFAGFEGEVTRFLAGRTYKLAIVEHFWCAPYVGVIRAERVFLDLHNIESALYAGYAAASPPLVSAAFRRFASASERMERAWLPRFDAVLTASTEDAARVAALAPGAAVCVYPNTLPPVPQPAVPEENVVAFSGNLEYRPNVEAVRFFRRRVWPVLRARHPALVWRLIGKNAHAVRRYTAGDARIEVQSTFDDAVGALAAARVVAVPLLAGSGTRLKILEAWAGGRPVVSTTIGAEGLGARGGEHLAIADTPGAFIDAVSDLLDSADARARIGRAGRCLYEQRFTWPHAWHILDSILQSIGTEPRPSGSGPLT